jgi:probable HAF family extracellular repeat protein
MADSSAAGAGSYLPKRLASGHLTKLPLLPTPPYDIVPPATYYTSQINGVGDIIGEAFNSASSFGLSVPFLSDGKKTIDLGTLGGKRGGAKAINARGEVVGYSETKTTPPPPPGVPNWDPGHAFIYTLSAKLVDLNSLIIGGPGAWELRMASDINAIGEIVGFGQLTSGQPPMHQIRAFLFEHGVVRDLGTLPNGGPSSANSISNRREIVGQAYTNGNQPVACIFLPGRGAVDLNSLINPALGWTLINATCVNDAGQIVGQGIRKDAQGEWGFLLTPMDAMWG